MSKTLFEKTRKARTTASLLGKDVEKLKEARKEIHATIQLLLRMKDAIDDLAEPAIAAVTEMYPSEGNPWILSPNAKAKMRKEDAKPLSITTHRLIRCTQTKIIVIVGLLVYFKKCK